MRFCGVQDDLDLSLTSVYLDLFSPWLTVPCIMYNAVQPLVEWCQCEIALASSLPKETGAAAL